MTPGASDRPPVWRRPRTLGYQEALRGLGGIVSPLLAGFSLAAIVTIVTSDKPPRFGDASVAAFAAAVALLLFSMQVAFLSLTQNSSPQDILMWRPEVTVSEEELQLAREVQASDFEEMTRLGRLSLITYGWGLVSFLLGVLLLLVPHAWTVGRGIAAVIAGAALLLEIWWLAANHWKRLPHPVVRGTKLSHAASWEGPPPPLDSIASSSVIDPNRSPESDPASRRHRV